MQDATARAADRHVYGLDILRCLAALLVASFHFTRTLSGIETAAPFGWIGVEIFFVISGYVIAYSAQQSTARQFLRGRFLRLYPAAWLVAAASAPMLVIVPAYYWRTVHLYLQTDPVSLLNSVALTGVGITGSYWTLPVELAFYACVFVLLLTGRFRWLRGFALALTVYGLPYLAWLAANDLHLIELPAIEFRLGGWNALLLRHGSLFALGLYLFAWRDGGLTRRDRLGAALATGLCLVEIACRASQQLTDHSVSAMVSLPRLIVQSETVFLLALVAIAASLRWNAVFPRRLRRVTRSLGLATYPFYLVHELLGGLVVYLVMRFDGRPLAAVAAALAVVAGFAYVLSSWFEPLLRREIAARLDRARGARTDRSASLGAT